LFDENRGNIFARYQKSPKKDFIIFIAAIATLFILVRWIGSLVSKPGKDRPVIGSQYAESVVITRSIYDTYQ